MSKKKKIIVISVAVTLALVMTVGGLIQAFDHEHMETGGHKLIGVGEMGYYDPELDLGAWWGCLYQRWDTRFIVTNPNCDKDLTIEWVALIAGEDVCCDFDDGPCWDAEDVIFEGTPDDWYDYTDENTIGPVIEIPGNKESERGVLSPHEVWQVSIAELIAGVEDYYTYEVIEDCDVSKYTLEVTWSGAYYSWWLGWRTRPLTGWQKEECRGYFDSECWSDNFPSFAISEAEMQLFPSRVPFRLPAD